MDEETAQTIKNLVGLITNIEEKLGASSASNHRIQSTLHELIPQLQNAGLSRDRIMAGLDSIRTDIIGQLASLEADQTTMRTAIMDRIDRLQGTVEMLRDDSRVNWMTADVSLSNSRNLRSEMEALQSLVSAMERRHQTLAALVEELRGRDTPKS